MRTPSEIPDPETEPLGSARYHLDCAFALLDEHYERAHWGVVSAAALAAHVRTSSGGPDQTAMLAALAALAAQRQAAKSAHVLLERFLWAAVGDVAAAEHVARAVGTSTRSVDATADLTHSRVAGAL